MNKYATLVRCYVGLWGGVSGCWGESFLGCEEVYNVWFVGV